MPPERELAQQFGVSRATVREALRHLQAQGLLTAGSRTSPLRAAGPEDAAARFRESLGYVVRLRQVSLADLVELRRAVEVAAFERAAASPIEAHLDEAREALSVMARPRVSAGDYDAADVAFHVALVAASGNEALHAVMLAVRESMKHYLDAQMRARGLAPVRERLTEEHRALLSAIERGDAKKAARLLSAHLEFYGT